MVLLLMENAGAERALVLFERNGSLYIEAEGKTGGEVSVLKSEPVHNEDGAESSSDSLPLSVINYASRTGEPVVARDLSEEPMFRNDAYVLKNRTKSALCVPVYKSGTALSGKQSYSRSIYS